MRVTLAGVSSKWWDRAGELPGPYLRVAEQRDPEPEQTPAPGVAAGGPGVDQSSAMSVESRIEVCGRRVLASPLWVGLAITAFLLVRTFFVSPVTLTSLVVLGTYAIDHRY